MPAGKTTDWLTPILVDYYTRDGSTLMMRLLASSPHIAVGRPAAFEKKYFNYLWRWSTMVDRTSWPKEKWSRKHLGSVAQGKDDPMMGPPPYRPMDRDLLEAPDGETSLGRRCFEHAWSEFSRQAIEHTRELHETPGAEVRYYAEKHLNTWRVNRDELPDHVVIALLRDPRDTFASILKWNASRPGRDMGGQSQKSEAEFFGDYLTRQRERMRWIASVEEGGEVQVIRYEDMVRDLPGVASRLTERLAVRFDPEAAVEDEALRDHPTSHTPEASVGRWKEDLPDEVAARLTGELADELDALGFEVDPREARTRLAALPALAAAATPRSTDGAQRGGRRQRQADRKAQRRAERRRNRGGGRRAGREAGERRGGRRGQGRARKGAQRPGRAGSDAARSGGPDTTLTTELPKRLEVGGGNMIFLDGRCWHPDGKVKALAVLVDGTAHPTAAFRMPRPNLLGRWDRWWAWIPFGPIESARTAKLELRAKLKGGGEYVAPLGKLQLEPGNLAATPEGNGRVAPPSGTTDAPLIAICMATYRPPKELFRKQIESIREQTHSNWVCLISDDGSGPGAIAEMKDVIGDDPRFRLSTASEQLGFYGNFERSLKLVPEDAAYIAFADQDDIWYPDKLQALQEGIEQSGANLAYGDMRIVSEQGEVVSETFWRYRRNNHKNFASVLIANTITGAASLFRADLLQHALPFPARHHKSFHDHWVASVALATGTIHYVDRPLHDYVQHGDAAQGFLRANRAGVERDAAGRRWLPWRGNRNRAEGREARRKGERGQHWRTVYFKTHARVQLVARVLQARCGSQMTRSRRRTLRRITGIETSPRGFAWLLARCLRPWFGATETFGRERKLAGAMIWRRLVRTRYRLRALGYRLRSAPMPVPLRNAIVERRARAEDAGGEPDRSRQQRRRRRRREIREQEGRGQAAPATAAATAAPAFDADDVESRLIWILGSPRTGSTWLLRLLIHPLQLRKQTGTNFVAGHGRPASDPIIPVNESHVASHIAPLLPPSDIATRDDQPDPSEFIFNTTRESNASYLFSSDYTSVWKPALRELVLTRFHAQIEQAAEQAGFSADPLVAIKEPNGSFAADVLMSLFPRSRMIFLQRDGRDVVDSLLDKAFSDRVSLSERIGEDDEDARLHLIKERSRLWVASTQATRAAFDAHAQDLRIDVRYEDLLDNTAGELARLFEWVGASRSEREVRDSAAANAFESAPQSRKGRGRPMRAATPGLWRKNMTQREQDVMEEIMADELRALGYELRESAIPAQSGG